MATTHVILHPNAQAANANSIIIDCNGVPIVARASDGNYDITNHPVNVSAYLAAGWTLSTEQQ
jgi:hypothetical protein